MTPSPQRFRAYLARLGWHGPAHPDAATLTALHQRHLAVIPFENLDIGAGRPIVLDPAALVAKVAEPPRGGICYELNGAFATLLEYLGYSVTLLSGGVYSSAREAFGPEFDHLVLRVEGEGIWLVDVGFGDGFRFPLRADSVEPQIQPLATFRLRDDGTWTILERRSGDGWKPDYRFTWTPRRLADFDAMCRFHQTSGESHFTRGDYLMRALPDRTIRLRRDQLRVSVGIRTVREAVLESEDAWVGFLRRWFGIESP